MHHYKLKWTESFTPYKPLKEEMTYIFIRPDFKDTCTAMHAMKHVLKPLIAGNYISLIK